MSSLHATLDLPPAPQSVPTARRVIAQLLTAWAAEAYREDAALLVSELVTNVVRHVPGEAAMTVEVHLTRTALQVAVVDGSTMAAGAPPPPAPGGHGPRLGAAPPRRGGAGAGRPGGA